MAKEEEEEAAAAVVAVAGAVGAGAVYGELILALV